jgi:hypothetical protein
VRNPEIDLEFCSSEEIVLVESNGVDSFITVVQAPPTTGSQTDRK